MEADLRRRVGNEEDPAVHSERAPAQRRARHHIAVDPNRRLLSPAGVRALGGADLSLEVARLRVRGRRAVGAVHGNAGARALLVEAHHRREHLDVQALGPAHRRGEADQRAPRKPSCEVPDDHEHRLPHLR
eukprot:711932-Rhodomonas_salina.2